jgi:hypothetical protein
MFASASDAKEAKVTANPPASPITPDTELLIARGAGCYQRLLSTLHGEEGPDPLPDSEDWLDDSFLARRDRPDMTTKGSLLHRPKLNLTDPDYARLDRMRPERSFSASTPEPGEPGRADEDALGQLKGLNELHAVGALTDEEFAEAKARVIGRLG